MLDQMLHSLDMVSVDRTIWKTAITKYRIHHNYLSRPFEPVDELVNKRYLSGRAQETAVYGIKSYIKLLPVLCNLRHELGHIQHCIVIKTICLA